VDLRERLGHPAPNKIDTEVVVPNGGAGDLKATCGDLDPIEAGGGDGVAQREQQGALIQVKVEVESGLGIGGKRGKDCMQVHERGMGLSRIVGQL
jgi:hypothetical protein